MGKPNNARALRCPRLRAMDVEHFDFESDQNQTRDGKPLALSSNHLLSRGSLLRNRSLQMTVARASTTRLWVTSFEFVVNAPLDVPVALGIRALYWCWYATCAQNMPVREGLIVGANLFVSNK